MEYSILLRPAAVRDLKALPSDVRKRIEKAIDWLKDDPRPSGVKKLVGFDDEWRLRVGHYRVLNVIDDAERRVTVARVAHRRGVSVSVPRRSHYRQSQTSFLVGRTPRFPCPPNTAS